MTQNDARRLSLGVQIQDDARAARRYTAGADAVKVFRPARVG
jgi:hypothetical protein